MGDRANAFIQTDKGFEGWRGIGIYSHWDGLHLHDVVKKHIKAAESRIGDSSYFARIVIHRTLAELADPMSETGHGLWTVIPPDNEHPILAVNAMTGNHWLCDRRSWAKDQPETSNPGEENA